LFLPLFSPPRFAGLLFSKLTSFAKKTGSIPNREVKARRADDTCCSRRRLSFGGQVGGWESETQ
jgi:hypothetical protein